MYVCFVSNDELYIFALIEINTMVYLTILNQTYIKDIYNLINSCKHLDINVQCNKKPVEAATQVSFSFRPVLLKYCKIISICLVLTFVAPKVKF